MNNIMSKKHAVFGVYSKITHFSRHISTNSQLSLNVKVFMKGVFQASN